MILHRLPTLLREAFDYPYREIANVLAQAMVYVLEGSIVMQAKGKAPVTLAPGQVLT